MHKTSNNGDNTINAHKLNMKSIALLKKNGYIIYFLSLFTQNKP